MGVDQSDNELVTIEVIHRYVELLDKYFGSVSYISTILLFYSDVPFIIEIQHYFDTAICYDFRFAS